MDEDPHTDEPSQADWPAIAAELDVPIEALEFLYDAMDFSPQYNGEDTESGQHSSGEQRCRTLVLYARDIFGDDSANAFSEGGLLQSEDWGRLVFALVDRELCEATECDRIEDFDARFDLTSDAESS